MREIDANIVAQSAEFADGFFRRALNAWPEALCVLKETQDGPMIAEINRAFEGLYQTTRSAAIGALSREFFIARASQRDFAHTESRLREFVPFRTKRLMQLEGKTIWLEVHFSPLLHDGIRYWLFMARDVTKTTVLSQRMAQLASAVDQASDVIAIMVWRNDAWIYDYVNEAFVRALGYKRADLLGSTSDPFIATSTNKNRFERMRSALRTGQTVRDEVVMRRNDGSEIEFEFVSRPLEDGQTGEFTSTVIVYRDVTAQRARERLLQHHAEHDDLTGLFNRRYFEDELARCVSMASAGAEHVLLFMDLDNFKNVNDDLGHMEGDEALKAAAGAFKAGILGSDPLARWGGDEFAAILYHCSLPNARVVAERILESLAERTGRWNLGVSIGIVDLRGASGIPQVVAKADKACYEAKNRGGNCIVIG